MQRGSFTDESISSYIDSTYRLVSFNAEIKDTINFKNQVTVNAAQPQMPFHQLAVALCKNNFVLPTLALLDEENNLVDAIPFYLPPSALKNILHYYGDDIYKSKSWQEYNKPPVKP